VRILRDCAVEAIPREILAPLDGALEFQAGNPVDGPLPVAALVGVVLGLVNERTARAA
jgi:hypothetical protein